MKHITTRTLKAAATVTTAAIALALLTGFVPTPDAASAASRTTAFENQLRPVTAVVTVKSSTEAPLNEAVETAARTTTAVHKATASTTPLGTRTSRATTAGNAQTILASYIARYPILRGATITYGDAQGYQAICYYKSGRIVISNTHTASLQRIIGHEIWHIIDYRDNGRIDWGENVPPK